MFTLTVGCHKIFKLHKKRWESTDLVKLLFLDTKNNALLLLTIENGSVELGRLPEKRRSWLHFPSYVVPRRAEPVSCWEVGLYRSFVSDSTFQQSWLFDKVHPRSTWSQDIINKFKENSVPVCGWSKFIQAYMTCAETCDQYYEWPRQTTTPTKVRLWRDTISQYRIQFCSDMSSHVKLVLSLVIVRVRCGTWTTHT